MENMRENNWMRLQIDRRTVLVGAPTRKGLLGVRISAQLRGCNVEPSRVEPLTLNLWHVKLEAVQIKGLSSPMVPSRLFRTRTGFDPCDAPDLERCVPPLHRACLCRGAIQGCPAHKKSPTLLGPPYDLRHRLTVGS